MSEFTRCIEFRPAFHRVDPDPTKNYGVGSVRLMAVLGGDSGTLVFHMDTGWYLPETWEWWQETGRIRRHRPERNPEGMVVDFHSVSPLFEGQTSRPNCEYLGGMLCYTDSGYSLAEPIATAFVARGEEGLWAELEQTYRGYYAPEQGV